MNRVEQVLAIHEPLDSYAELVGVGTRRGSFAGVAGAGPIAALFAGTTRRYPEHGNTPRTRHLVLNLDGDTASARWTWLALHRPRSRRRAHRGRLGHLLINPRYFDRQAPTQS